MWSAPPVDFDLVTSVRDGHLAARVRAISITPDVTERFLREIRYQLVGERLGHLLLEFELAHAMTEAEVFDVMRTFSSVMPGLRIAVMNGDPRHHLSLQFGIRVSQEFGQDYRYFTDTDAAHQWLAAN
jgi:hypothetical protein